MSKFYYLSENDHLRPSWVLFTPANKSTSKRKVSEVIPPTVNALLGPRPESPMKIKLAYAGLRCPRCGRYEADRAFDIGFDGEASIKIKGDFGHAADRVFLVTNAFLNVLKAVRIQGYETKPIGATGWHALRITVLVDANPDVFKTAGSPCPECGRPEESWGVPVRVTDLAVPKATNTFFTTKQSWPSAPFFDRSIFLSDEMVKALKDSGIKGGYCKRLLTDEEWNWVEDFRKKGIPKDVPGITIYLTGAPSKKRS